MAISKWSAMGIAAALSCLPAIAQQATIQGVVTDQSGAPVPSATVAVRNLATGVTSRMETNERGLYAFPFLLPGNYSLNVVKESFAPQTRENLKLDVGQIARADFLLTVGTVLQRVEVSAAATLLESENTQMGQVIENKRILEMPLNQRNYLALAQLSPGVLPAVTSGVGIKNGRDDASVVAMGQHGNQIAVVVDGADNNSTAISSEISFVATAVRPSVDAVGEFKVLTNNFSAEYGFRAGPKIIVSLKSGTNNLHGTLFEFLRNEKLDGTNFFANRSGSKKPAYRQNQFGGVLGGPVRRDRTFFFFGYEGTRIRQGVSYLATVPSSLARTGDFSHEVLTKLTQVYDPLTTATSGTVVSREPFPNSIIPKNRFDPVVSNVVNLYPLPNVAGREFTSNNFFSSPTNQNNSNEFDAKVDHSFSDRNRTFYRYSYHSNNQLTNGPLPVSAGGGTNAASLVELHAHNLVANWTHVFSPVLYNSARFDYTHMPSIIDNLLQEPLNAKYGIKNAPGDALGNGLNGGFSAFEPSGFANLGVVCCSPNVGEVYNAHAADDIVKQIGSHSLKAGVEWRQTKTYRMAAREVHGEFDFSGVYTAQQPNVAASRSATGNAFADMLLGQSSAPYLGNNSGENPVAPYWGAYLQDSWKATPNLTINWGLRWEFFGSPAYIGGANSGFGGVSNYITMYNEAVPNDPRRESFIRPTGDKDCGCIQDWHDFSPRLGIAWRVTPKTVVRASGGIFHGQADSIINDRTAWAVNPPQFTEVTTNGTNTTAAAIAQNGLPLVQFPATQLVQGVGVVLHPIQNKTFYSSQWFSEVQRELPGDLLFAVGYQGNTGTRLAASQNINFPGPSPSVPASQRLLRPQFSTVELRGIPMGLSSYQAMTARVEKRFSRGLTFLTAYTWSHSLDDQAEFNDYGNTGPANPYNLRAERGSSNLDQRHSFTTSATWEPPLGRGRRFGAKMNSVLDAFVGGWQVGGILVLRTGMPFDVSYPGDPQNSGTLNRGNRVASGTLANPTIDKWFDQTAFVQSAPGVFGNTGRNVLTGPGTRNLDFLAGKRFKMPWEGHSLQFRFESFNFSNTPKFGQPNGSLRAAATATITSAGDPRRIQFGLKYAF